MFDLVHKYRRVVQIILALLIVPFAIWGLDTYTQFRGGRDTVATVEGMEISQRELADELRQQQEAVRRRFGGAIDPAMFDSPELRLAVLESLVTKRLLEREAARGERKRTRPNSR